MDGEDLVIIDRQVTDEKLRLKRMDLLALKQVEYRKFGFWVIEVKLGNSPELIIMTSIDEYIDSFCTALDIEIEHLKDIGGTKYRIYNGVYLAKLETEWVYTFGMEVELSLHYYLPIRVVINNTVSRGV
jgi:hypothetical protein